MESESIMTNENTAPPKKLPYSFAKRQGILLSGSEGDSLQAYCRPGLKTLSLAEVRRFVGQPIDIEEIPADRFNQLLQKTYEKGAGENGFSTEDFSEDFDLKALAEQLPETVDLLESEDDAPIIRLINGLLTEAIKDNASDIHLEPFESRLQIRFRIDGVLREVLEPNRVLAPLIISRIKVMANLDIAERRKPQDGKAKLTFQGREIERAGPFHRGRSLCAGQRQTLVPSAIPATNTRLV